MGKSKAKDVLKLRHTATNAGLKESNQDGSDDNEQNGAPHTIQRFQSDADDIQIANNRNNNSRQQDTKEMTALDEPVTSVDKCIPCKLFLVILSFILCLITLILVGAIS